MADTLEELGTVGLVALLGIAGWAVYEQIQGAKAVGQGIGGAAAATGNAAGQTLSTIGTGAHNAEQGIGGVFSGLGSWLSGITGGSSGGAAATSTSGPPVPPNQGAANYAAQWRVAAASNIGGSDPNDWGAFRQAAMQVLHIDVGPTPWGGWPDGFGGQVFNATAQQFE